MEKLSIENLLNFLNRFSTEPNLGWSCPHLYEKQTEFEIQWMFDKTTDLNWYFKRKDTAVWTNVNAEVLEQVLVEEKVDLAHFEIELLRTICVQAVCAHFYIQKASELIGKDKVDATIKLMDDLLNSKKEEKVTKLRVVDKKKRDE